jgi:hypothetical protein
MTDPARGRRYHGWYRPCYPVRSGSSSEHQREREHKHARPRHVRIPHRRRAPFHRPLPLGPSRSMARKDIRTARHSLARGLVLLCTSRRLPRSPQHILSIPFFAPLHTSLRTTFNTYAATAPVTLLTLPFSPLFNKHAGAGTWQPNAPRIAVPSALAALALNVVTQGFCIRGVNKLTAVRRHRGTG